MGFGWEYEDLNDWNSLQLDFSEFLNQDFTQYDLPQTQDSFVSEASYDIDFEALLAATSTCDSTNSTTATTTTDSSSATLTPVDFSTRQDPINFEARPFETSTPFDLSTELEHVSSSHSRPAARTIGPLMIDLPLPVDTLPQPSHQLQAGRPTPPPSVSNAGPSSSNTTSPSIAPGATRASPSVSDSPEEGGDSRKRKRERNTEAARRYRQRRQDRLEELEEALAAMQKERDELRIKLARSEAETDILRGLMAKK
ncbi:hypothetical protein MBLNU13_g01535t1 [Cladosporium sp. NU13]